MKEKQHKVYNILEDIGYYIMDYGPIMSALLAIIIGTILVIYGICMMIMGYVW